MLPARPASRPGDEQNLTTPRRPSRLHRTGPDTERPVMSDSRQYVDPDPNDTGRVRARTLRQRLWRCVTGAADRRRGDRRLCAIAGELCVVRGKAPLADLLWRGWPPGTAVWVFNSVLWGVQLGGEVIGPVYRAAAAVRGPASSSGRLSLCVPDDEAPCCGLPRSGPGCGPVPAHRPRCFRRSHAGTGRAGGCCRRMSPAECGPAGPFRVSLDW